MYIYKCRGSVVGVHLGILGPVTLEADDGAPVPIGPPQRRAVFALLAANAGRPTLSQQLLEGVWAGHPPPTAAKNLHVHACQLRKLVGDRLSSCRGGYRFDPADGDVVDALAFVRGVRRAREAADRTEAVREYRAALAFWRGEAMADVVAAGMLAAPARLLDRQRAEAIEEWVDAELLGGDPATLVAPLTELADRFPFEERLREALMIALDRQGHSAAALAVYDDLADLLTARLGTLPGERVRTAAATIRRRRASGPPPAGARAPSARMATEGPPIPLLADLTPALGAGPVESLALAPVRQLPPDLADFVDRQGVLEVLAAARSAGAAPTVVCVAGPAGAGKTALAVHVAHRLRVRFPDTQLYAALRASTAGPVNAATAIGRLLRALGVPAERVPADPDEATALYRSLVADRGVLVVVDDAATEGQVRPLVPAGEGSLALVTTRRRLAGLSGAHIVEVDALSAGEADRLLRRVAGDERVDADRAAAAELLERCGRLALAVRAAGARLATRPTWRITDLVALLDRDGPAGLRVGDIDVGRELAAAQAALRAGDRRLLRRLAHDRRSEFGLAEAAALVGGDPVRVQQGLDRLADAFMLRPAADPPAGPRYRLPTLVRTVAVAARQPGRGPLPRPAAAGSPAARSAPVLP